MLIFLNFCFAKISSAHEHISTSAYEIMFKHEDEMQTTFATLIMKDAVFYNNEAKVSNLYEQKKSNTSFVRNIGFELLS